MPDIEQLELPEEVSLYEEQCYVCPYCGIANLTTDELDRHIAACGRCDSYYL